MANAEDPEPGGKLAVWTEGEQADVWRQRTIESYDAGHMMYLHPPSLEKMRRDLVRFYGG